jgi:5-formyltetrahydrofolate cyclo-ligase
MIKAELRKKYRLLRENLTNTQIDDLSIEIANQLLQLPILGFSFYHVFLSIEELKEINTDFILSILSGKDKHIVVSKCDFKTGLLTNFLLTDNTKIVKNSWNIPEPVDGIEISNDKLDVVFVPLLAFDKQGNRIGYGKGFYDKFLASCKPETIKIGLSFFEAEELIDNIHENDVGLDYCVTPKKIYGF